MRTETKFGILVGLVIVLTALTVFAFVRPQATVSLGSSRQTTPSVLTISDDYTSLPSLYLWNTTGGLEVAGTVTFAQPTSSTITIGSATSQGCLRMYNASGDGLVYVTVASSTITATTTKPSVCK